MTKTAYCPTLCPARPNLWRWRHLVLWEKSLSPLPCHEADLHRALYRQRALFFKIPLRRLCCPELCIPAFVY